MPYRHTISAKIIPAAAKLSGFSESTALSFRAFAS